jgi:hypothetical protein
VMLHHRQYPQLLLFQLVPPCDGKLQLLPSSAAVLQLVTLCDAIEQLGAFRDAELQLVPSSYTVLQLVLSSDCTTASAI